MNWKRQSSFAKHLLLTGLTGLVVGLANAADTIKVAYFIRSRERWQSARQP